MSASGQVTVSDDPPQPSLAAVAIRLADEGIPVRAIARSTGLPSGEVYEALRDALQQGFIVEIPRDDWPPGSNRGVRAVFNGTPLEQEEALKCACSRFFKLSPLSAVMLAVMLRRNEVTKDQLHHCIEQNRPGPAKSEQTEPKMVDVMICNLRKKLRPHGITIETMWGIGYLIPPQDREKAVALLTAYSQCPAAAQVN